MLGIIGGSGLYVAVTARQVALSTGVETQGFKAGKIHMSARFTGNSKLRVEEAEVPEFDKINIHIELSFFKLSLFKLSFINYVSRVIRRA